MQLNTKFKHYLVARIKKTEVDKGRKKFKIPLPNSNHFQI